MQSGTTTYPSTATVSDIEVEMNVVTAGLDKWNASKWEDSGATGPSQISRYLASQYQVFFGSEDITEDFFTYNQANAATRVATEDWIYNPREFWSQSKWWDPDLGRSRFKESTTQGPGEANFLPGGGICQRELYAKMTLLTLNFRELQNYLKNRTLDQARTKTITALAVPPTIGVEPTLASKFNKLIYAARCNRYPVNPLNLRPNPWNTDLPNNSDDFKDLGLATDSATKAMQPYTLPYAPSMRSQQFFQGVRIINGGVIDGDGAILARGRRDTPAHDASAIVQEATNLIRELSVGHKIDAVGVACAAYINRSGSLVFFSPNLAWRDEPLKQRLESAVDLPVMIENDANAAAWGEFRFGAALDANDVVMLTVGTGFGGGVVVDGVLMRGAFGVAAELGHMRVVPDGRRCGCGNRGCWEQYASGSALVREARELVASGSPHAARLSDLCAGDPAALRGPDVTRAATEGDPAAVELLADPAVREAYLAL